MCLVGVVNFIEYNQIITVRISSATNSSLARGETSFFGTYSTGVAVESDESEFVKGLNVYRRLSILKETSFLGDFVWIKVHLSEISARHTGIKIVSHGRRSRAYNVS